MSLALSKGINKFIVLIDFKYVTEKALVKHPINLAGLRRVIFRGTILLGLLDICQYKLTFSAYLKKKMVFPF
jgi:hypothetical protein